MFQIFLTMDYEAVNLVSYFDVLNELRLRFSASSETDVKDYGTCCP